MGRCESKIREVRFIIEDDLTQAYVLMDAIGDCPLGVQGWHHKTFPDSWSVQDILKRLESGEVESPVLWAQAAPPEP